MAQEVVTAARTADTARFNGSKEQYVQAMFAEIAPRYDLLNDLLSFRMHRKWRRLAVRLAGVSNGQTCLDVCTGTGAFAVDLARAVGTGGRVAGSDFCAPMIKAGLNTLQADSHAPIRMTVGNTETLPFATGVFDVVTVGFGIRNVESISAALREMARVAKPGGKIVVLEFTRPEGVSPLINWYLFHFLPWLGGLLSRRDAYNYLPQSMKSFVNRHELAQSMEQSGIENITVRSLNFGTVCIHIGTRNEAKQEAYSR
jgi:demethylmenaquinone methyltransferase/2-methoxy-6-polyprenyl-1,4-benzoquinol methylase